jgi:hypothetical protein
MKIFYNRSGQTLIEAMVALFVLTIGLLGVLSLITQSIVLSRTVSQETTATYLAAEGVELAKNIVDHDIYVNRENGGAVGWAKGGEDPTFGIGGNFELDYTSCNNVQPGLNCIPQAYRADPLGFDPTTGLYSYTASIKTPFVRQVKVLHWDPASPNQMIVISSVLWKENGVSEIVRMEDYFYNWQP